MASHKVGRPKLPTQNLVKKRQDNYIGMELDRRKRRANRVKYRMSIEYDLPAFKDLPINGWRYISLTKLATVAASKAEVELAPFSRVLAFFWSCRQAPNEMHSHPDYDRRLSYLMSTYDENDANWTIAKVLSPPRVPGFIAVIDNHGVHARYVAQWNQKRGDTTTKSVLYSESKRPLKRLPQLISSSSPTMASRIPIRRGSTLFRELTIVNIGNNNFGTTLIGTKSQT